MNDAIVVIIPARFASSRLPGKPLLDLGGKPMIQHVYERAMQADVAAVWVATDDARIFDAVVAFGGRVVMTAPDHVSGTDRVAEAARGLAATIVVNVQGDEPLLDPALINRVAAPLRADATLDMATVAHPLYDAAEANDPNVVKVVCDRRGLALYFSRLPIPFDRDRQGEATSPQGVTAPFLRHVGLYAYRADFLQTFARLPATGLEQRERLEQLRALEYGHTIHVVVADGMTIGVDTPADAQRVRQLLGA
ncbi:MAG: 3-deoxy-manno-octulosonate cytidylyltransferase [Magnetococcales bacterium]|nr:3-deoxy-manno-octulosonate cytidylyltransferase [Magnetococcales bacterium]